MFGIYLDLKSPQKSITGIILGLINLLFFELSTTPILTWETFKKWKFHKSIMFGLYLELKRPQKSIPDVILGPILLVF